MQLDDWKIVLTLVNANIYVESVVHNNISFLLKGLSIGTFTVECVHIVEAMSIKLVVIVRMDIQQHVEMIKLLYQNGKRTVRFAILRWP